MPGRIGNAHPNIVPYQVFPVADGYIIIATGNDSQYQKLCGVLGAPEIAKDPRYIDNKSRLANRADIVGKLSALTMKFKMQDLADKLEAVGVPAGPINNLDQVFADPHIRHRGMQLDLPSDDAKGGTIPGIRTPIDAGRQTDGVGQSRAAARPAFRRDFEGNRRGLRPGGLCPARPNGTCHGICQGPTHGPSYAHVRLFRNGCNQASAFLWSLNCGVR